ncbi:MAG: hypothetical protein Q7R95_07810 [bacterium]|nr:hypothetical protein [bacterium]
MVATKLLLPIAGLVGISFVAIKFLGKSPSVSASPNEGVVGTQWVLGIRNFNISGVEITVQGYDNVADVTYSRPVDENGNADYNFVVDERPPGTYIINVSDGIKSASTIFKVL